MNLSMEHISKSFGANNVLEDVSFSLRTGEICAFLGENGAGKSTLMNILGGVIPANQGRIVLDGKQAEFHTPLESLKAGIAFVHQELNLVEDLTVYENLFLHAMPHKGIFLDAEQMKRRAQDLFRKMELDLDPKTMVRDLDAAYKQIVEISRALLQNASIIIMDEPTTSLNGPEIKRIFDMMRKLQSRGVSIIFISHKLNEVMEICDRYVVLRDGKVITSGLVAETNPDALATAMVGHEVHHEKYEAAKSTGEEVLRLEHLTQKPAFEDISLTVHAGEIFGISGLLGDGRSELFRTVFGDYAPHFQGCIYWRGHAIRIKSPHHARKLGIGYLPGNRKENAIIGDMSVQDNGVIVNLPKLRKGLFCNRKAMNSAFDEQVQALQIKVKHRDDSINSLSGGNQQKVVLAKWLMIRPKLLILDNPTQGVDVGAKEEIYATVNCLAKEGTAIVVLSSEAQEIMRICDRCMIMAHGKNMGIFTRAEMSEQKMMLMAAGGNGEKG